MIRAGPGSEVASAGVVPALAPVLIGRRERQERSVSDVDEAGC